MAAKTSAALLAYRYEADSLQVFLGHMGGPFWQHRDDGGWSIPKGEYDAAREQPEAVAAREFAEEIGVAAPDGNLLDLGVFRQPSGKRIQAYAVRAHDSLRYLASNTFDLEWPPRSGRVVAFPEIDRAEWFPLDRARGKVVPGQIPILDALAGALAGQ